MAGRRRRLHCCRPQAASGRSATAIPAGHHSVVGERSSKKFIRCAAVPRRGGGTFTCLGIHGSCGMPPPGSDAAVRCTHPNAMMCVPRYLDKARLGGYEASIGCRAAGGHMAAHTSVAGPRLQFMLRTACGSGMGRCFQDSAIVLREGTGPCWRAPAGHGKLSPHDIVSGTRALSDNFGPKQSPPALSPVMPCA